MPSQSIEDYIKAIWSLTDGKDRSQAVSTNALAAQLSTSQASVSEMFKRLAEKNFIEYIPYQGATLTNKGRKLALRLIRKHRLWEVFLHDTLGFGWEEVHDIAEQLEHINSPELIQRLDAFLGHPSVDPHGDLIPDANGYIPKQRAKRLIDLVQGQDAEVVGVLDSHSGLLSLLSQKDISLGCSLMVKEILPFDGSRIIEVKNRDQIELSQKVCEQILIQEIQ